MLLSRWRYYLASIPTLFTGIRNWPVMLAVFVGVPLRKPIDIHLRNGCRFRVRSRMDIWVIKETCLDRDYERHGVPLRDGWTVIDIGGWVGDFAICTARAFPGSTVYVFEPFPETFARLQENLALNGVANVRAFPLAITGTAGRVALDPTPGATVLHTTSSAEEPDPEVQAAEAITLADIFERYNLESCDFLKIDCEGGEYDILFNTDPQTLAKIRHICLEYHEGVTP
ncbi:MAG: FkbM family methyltransferase, partial [Chloroflexi bacterium]|nr:FkbM family methyltransferase [Chloroflexota bacterium]